MICLAGVEFVAFLCYIAWPLNSPAALFISMTFSMSVVNVPAALVVVTQMLRVWAVVMPKNRLDS